MCNGKTRSSKIFFSIFLPLSFHQYELNPKLIMKHVLKTSFKISSAGERNFFFVLLLHQQTKKHRKMFTTFRNIHNLKMSAG